MSVQTALYRSISRASRRIDSDGVSRSLLVARPQRMWDRVRGTNINLKDDEINRILWDFNQGEFYKPSANKMTNIVREKFREEEGDLQLGFSALRRLNDAVYM